MRETRSRSVIEARVCIHGVDKRVSLFSIVKVEISSELSSIFLENLDARIETNS